MNEKQINKAILALLKEVVNLSAEEQMRLGKLVSENKKKEKAISEANSDISSSLSSLRICLKYLLFDLEATRREKNVLKKIVDKMRPENDYED